MKIFTPNTLIKSEEVNTNFAEIASALYPVGSIYISVVSTNPETLFGFGTWVAFATGRTLVGIDTGQTEFNTIEKTGGHKATQQHTHTQNSHLHNAGDGRSLAIATSSTNRLTGSGTYQEISWGNINTGSTTATNQNYGTGDSQNLQPYITTYMWKRTA